MKELYLVRHAKSSWDDHSVPDHDRPLNKRGRRDAPYMSAWFAKKYGKPDLLITSTARRAQETADAFAAACGISEDSVVRTREIYQATVQDILDQIAWLATNEHERVMLIGHNPTLTYVLEALVKGDVNEMSTCSVAVIRFADASSWKDLHDGELVEFASPKHLDEHGD